jgi:hypothetical protein
MDECAHQPPSIYPIYMIQDFDLPVIKTMNLYLDDDELDLNDFNAFLAVAVADRQQVDASSSTASHLAGQVDANTQVLYLYVWQS